MRSRFCLGLVAFVHSPRLCPPIPGVIYVRDLSLPPPPDSRCDARMFFRLDSLQCARPHLRVWLDPGLRLTKHLLQEDRTERIICPSQARQDQSALFFKRNGLHPHDSCLALLGRLASPSPHTKEHWPIRHRVFLHQRHGPLCPKSLGFRHTILHLPCDLLHCIACQTNRRHLPGYRLVQTSGASSSRRWHRAHRRRLVDVQQRET